MNAPPLAATASARSAVYWLLADLFLTCPDEAFIRRLRQELASELKRGSHPLTGQLSALHDALPSEPSEIAELAIEYTRLFGAVSPHYGPRPPYGSVHTAAGAGTDVTERVRHFYFEAGLVPPETSVPPDHLGVEFRFMALLCHSESDAWSKGERAEAGKFIQHQREFLERHLLSWAPSYLKDIFADACDPYISAFLVLARKILDRDIEHTREVSPMRQAGSRQVNS